jgi:hypothetical protein
MSDNDRPRRGFPALLAAAGIVALVSLALSAFFFDRRLIVFQKILPEKVTVYSSAANLGALWGYFFALLPVIVLAVLAAGVRLAGRTGRRLSESLFRQAATLTPLLFLPFGRFLSGKYIRTVVDIPLYPLLVAGTLAAAACLNAGLHFGFRPLASIKAWFFAGPEARVERRKTALLLAFLSLFFMHFISRGPFFHRFTSLMVFTGDEPKYLRMTHSLATDGDLDVTDDFVGDEVEVQWRLQRAQAAGERSIGHFSVVGRDGGIYHFHMPGISFLMLPGYLLDLAVFPRDVPNTQAIMFLPAGMPFTRGMFFLLALGLFFLAARLFGWMFGSRLMTALLLAVLIFATKVPEFLFQVYPESAAIFFLLLGLNAALFPFRRTGWNAALLVLSVGFLPWLHQRFIPLSLCLYGMYVFREAFERRRWKSALAVSLALVAAGAAYLYYFYNVTGSPLPWSMYSLWGTSYTRAAILPSGFFGYLFDTGSGLLSLTPVFFFTLAGIYWGLKIDRRRAAMLLLLILPYFALISITPWHGLAWETTRMSLVLYPVFLALAGYAFRALGLRPSWPLAAFYAACLGFVLVNKTERVWEISLGNVLILPHQVGYIIQCFFALTGLYLALWGLDRLAGKKERGLIRPDGLRRAAGTFLRGFGAIFRTAAARRTCLGLTIALPAAYLLVFLNNWDDRKMAMSYFEVLGRIGRSEDIALHPRGHPDAARRKGAPRFVDIFKWTVPLELLPGRGKTAVRLGPGCLADRCPPGCYKADLELFDAPPELSLLSLDFLGETREMPVHPRPGQTIVSTIYLVFEGLTVTQEFAVRHEGRILKPVKGRLTLYPVPCLVFDGRLMIRLSEDLYPEHVRAEGPHSYLSFVANSRRDNAVFTLRLSSSGGSKSPEESRARASETYAVRLRNRQRHRVDVRLERRFFSGEGDGILVAVEDAGGGRLAARSAWLPVRRGAWFVPLKP